MGRRVRHLNPISAGANLALDSRFIVGLSNNSNVQSWTSRIGAAVTFSQPTSARQPIYLTNIQGGQPVVRFTFANQQWMSNSSIMINPTLPAWTIIGVARTPISLIYTQNSNISFLAAQSSEQWTVYSRPDSFTIVNTAPAAYGVISLNNTVTASANGRNGTAQIYTMPSRGPIASTTTGATANLPTNRNNTVPNIYTNADICSVAIIPVGISVSLQRRLMDASLYSFKLSSK